VRDSSWLCPTPNHRERFFDMQPRLRAARLFTMLALCATAVMVMGRGGWPLLAVCVVNLVVLAIGGSRLERRRRPELWVFYGTILNLQLALGAAVLMTGGPRTQIAGLLAIPVLGVAARFSNRGLMVGAPVSALLVLATTLGADPRYALHHPESVAVPLLLVLCAAAYASPLIASDIRHRAHSTLDQLTGLLNRRALEPRFAEIAQQAALSHQPVSVVLADIDRFKHVNDEHGHAVGDEVLRDVAAALRSSLRSFELLYRYGGEEFLLLLPGADEQAAARIAETLRKAVESLYPAGLEVTCSFGVATATGGEDNFGEVMLRADAALYTAKRNGRNRVERAGVALAAAA
jgi:diguanylate cyclase (GGDEF)-like protein